MGSPRNTIDRMISTRSTEGDSYVDNHAGLISPQDNNALSRMVNRTVEVDEKAWAKLHINSQNAPTVKDADSGKLTVQQVGKSSEKKVLFWRKGFPVINPYTSVYGWWCAFVLFTDATYTAFVVPIGVGFNTSSVQWDWVGYFDFIAGVTFAFELLVSWNVAFVATYNLRKRIVLKRSKIAEFYVWHSTFIFDFISTMVFVVQCIGYGLGSAGTGSGTIIQVIQILRALRLLRLMRLLQQLFVMSLTAPQTHVPLINRALPVWLSYLAQLLYIVGLFINFLACIWVFVAYREEMTGTWINNYSPFVSGWSSETGATELTSTEAKMIPGPDIYLAAAYWSLTTVSTIGFGDILPITNAERAVMLMSQITGVLFFGILLGSITSLLQRASQEVKDAQMFREKMGSVSEWMGRVKLPRELKAKIRAYYAEVWVRQTVVENDLNLFQELPTHLRAQVAWRSNKAILDKVNTFKDLSEETQFMIVGRAKPVKVAPGHEICAQGDPADCIWLLHEGDVIATYHYREAEIEKAPAIVGESALLAGSEGQYSVRPCGYRALTACIMWEITMQDLQPIVDWQEDVAEILEAKARRHLLERQSEHPHLWGMNSGDFDDLGKDAGGNDDANDGSLSGTDDEGIDAENNDMKHYSNGKAEFEINRPSATLKHPGRSGKPYMRKDVQEEGDSKQSNSNDKSGTDLLDKLSTTAPDANHVVITMPSGDSNQSGINLTRTSPDSSNTSNLAEPHDSAYSTQTAHRGQLPSYSSQQDPGDTAYASHSVHRGRLPEFVRSAQRGIPELGSHKQPAQQQVQDGSGAAAMQFDAQRLRADNGSAGEQKQQARSGCADQHGGEESQRPTGEQQGQGGQQQQPQRPGLAVANFVQPEPLQDSADKTQSTQEQPQGQQHSERRLRHQQPQQLHQQQQHQHQMQQLSRRSRSYSQSPRRHLQKRPSHIQPRSETNSGLLLVQPPLLSRDLDQVSAPAGQSSEGLSHVSAPVSPSVSCFPSQLSPSAQNGSGPQMASSHDQLSHGNQNDSVAQDQAMPPTNSNVVAALQGLLDAAESIKAACLQMQQQLQDVSPK